MYLHKQFKTYSHSSRGTLFRLTNCIAFFFFFCLIVSCCVVQGLKMIFRNTAVAQRTCGSYGPGQHIEIFR